MEKTITLSNLALELDNYLRVNDMYAETYKRERAGINVPALPRQLGELGNIFRKCFNSTDDSALNETLSSGHVVSFKEELAHMLGITDGRVNNETLNAFLLAHTRLIVTKNTTDLLIYNYAEGIYEPAQGVLGRILAHLLNYSHGDVWSKGLETSVLGLLERKAPVVDDDKLDTKFYVFGRLQI